MQNCWKCGEHVADGIRNCPSCSAPVNRNAIDQMATIGPGGGPGSQIVPGIVINDRYQIQREVGRGGMGIVYLAVDRVMDVEVALKVIPQELCLDPNAVASLKRETAIALKLTHEHIVRLHNLETWEGQAFVVMEYVSGGTLSHLRSEHGGKVTLEEALPYLSQIASALDYSHSSVPAVIHRDLKPLNILLTEDGKIKIADFGLARVLRDSATRISGHESAGTLAYMAPEQIRGKGIGKATDVYAFAAIIYELLSGNPPFYTGDLRWQILHEEVEPLDTVPDHVNAALQAGLAKDRDDRPESAAELLALIQGEKQPRIRKSRSKKTEKKRQQQPQGSKSFGRVGIFASWVLICLAALAAAGWFFKGDIDKLVRSAPILTIESEPPGATVFVDKGEAGKSPLSIQELESGPHEITAQLDRYSEYKKIIFIQQGSPVHLKAELNPAPFGDLKIESIPKGAKVSVDGKELAKTPALLSQLPAGRILVKVSKEGYDTWSRQLDVRPLHTTEVSASLVSVYGQLELNSDPLGAVVFIDGQKQGETPLTVDNVRSGERLIRFEKEKYSHWESNIIVKGAESVSVSAKLQFGLGQLSIKSNPSGSLVRLNGENVGQTPLLMKEMQPGWVDLAIEKEGFEDAAARVEVKAGKLEISEFVLVEKSTKGKLTVRAVPENARVRILNIAPSYSPGMELEAGRYHLEVSASGYEKEERWIELAEGDDIEINFKLRQGRFAAMGKGTIIDRDTGLMWAEIDNGSDINWKDAQRYCERFSGGGYSDWRLPTLNELKVLYDSGLRFPRTTNQGPVKLSAWFVWAEKLQGDSVIPSFSFNTGNESFGRKNSYSERNYLRNLHYRALPVRHYK